MRGRNSERLGVDNGGGFCNGGTMNELNDIDSVVNRHMARLLTDLEDAQCPAIFRDAVRSALAWLRKDLKERVSENAERKRIG